MEKQDERSELMQGSCQTPEADAQPNRKDGNPNTPVMTEEEVSDLLARLQDILFLWSGSDSRIIGNYVMTAFPVPVSMKIDKTTVNGGHDKAFAVNGVPVVGVS